MIFRQNGMHRRPALHLAIHLGVGRRGGVGMGVNNVEGRSGSCKPRGNIHPQYPPAYKVVFPPRCLYIGTLEVTPCVEVTGVMYLVEAEHSIGIISLETG